MKTRSRGRHAWFHYLPGVDSGPGKKGILVNELDFMYFKRSCQFTVEFVQSPKAAGLLAELAAKGKALPELWYVRRMRNTPGPEDDMHILTIKAVVRGIAIEKAKTKVNLTWRGGAYEFRGMTISNPGPPADAPAVAARGPNSGWVHGVPGRGRPGGLPIEVHGFRPPRGTGRLGLAFAGNEPLFGRLNGLKRSGRTLDELILVLPDRPRRRYIEYKLFDARVEAARPKGQRGVRDVVFRSDFIEYLTGEPK